MRSANTQPWATAFRLSGASICPYWVLLGRLIVYDWLELDIGRFHQAIRIHVGVRYLIKAPNGRNGNNLVFRNTVRRTAFAH